MALVEVNTRKCINGNTESLTIMNVSHIEDIIGNDNDEI